MDKEAMQVAIIFLFFAGAGVGFYLAAWLLG